ncbi:WYL domain-containing protein [Sporosarcina sp. ACRSL]|uniref:WYL domain-containing protein n=1 Tax=Sporosarcina sp. ACRSL TaxID=2918215 RepID=UPI001EF73E61|nr:WYL domain-containing protein [Sporosarcina sp. ACRSL]MCG7344100.1 WYL domain-containing protein [Sporosarcina sp. ACRSL]
MKLVNKLNDPDFIDRLRLTNMNYEAEEIAIEAGPFVPTNTEKAWLFYFLRHEDTGAFLDADTRETLLRLLNDQQASPSLHNYLTEKGKPDIERAEAPLVKTLRSFISAETCMHISYQTNNGATYNEEGIPYWLMYNIAKKRWYLWWLRHDPECEPLQRRRLTPVTNISAVSSLDIDKTPYAEELEQLLPKYEDKRVAALLWKPLYENMDVQRLFHAFSSFEREIVEENGSYQLLIHYYPEEEKYLLSKIRLFGPHVRLLSPKALQDELIHSAKMALKNYTKS